MYEAFFGFHTSLVRILALDNLIKRFMIIVIWGCMSKPSGKYVEHVLLHYSVAIELCYIVFCLFGVNHVMFMQTIDVQFCCKVLF